MLFCGDSVMGETADTADQPLILALLLTSALTFRHLSTAPVAKMGIGD
jgi:hypothetical protein